MPQNEYIFTSESVSEGHPDKLCDQISDAVLDAYLTEDSESRVACETLATTNLVVLAGEVKGPSSVKKNIELMVRECVKEIGYEQNGFHWNYLNINNVIHNQSSDIAIGVDSDGAGDQGIMFGYAINETEELMPAPLHYAHAVLRNLSAARRCGDINQFGPDAKSQISVRYVDGKAVEVTSIVLSIQHFDEALTSQNVREIVEPYIRHTLPEEWINEKTKWHINPTGKFVIGGPDGDCGLTGRKIIVDTYGGAAPHGGGAFSGKDPTKVDRSAAYAARYLAKNVVAAELATKCCIQLSYAIGVAEPQSVYVNTYETEHVDPAKIKQKICDSMDLTPRGIRRHLGLGQPIYKRTATYGHFGRQVQEDGGFSWERTDLVGELKSIL